MLVNGQKSDILVTIHTVRAPAANEWDAYIALVRKSIETRGHGAVRGLSITDGGAPDAVQRSQLNQLTKEHPVPVSVITDSALVHGVVTALSWFNAGIRAFRPEAGAKALRHLGLSTADIALVAEALRKSESALPSATTLRALRW